MDSKDETSGKAIGGKARWAGMTLEERQEASRKLVEAKAAKLKLPVAAYSGVIKLGEIEIACHVLDNGTQILSERAVSKALGAKRGGSHWKRLKAQDVEDEAITLPVLSAGNITPFVDSELAQGLQNKIVFRTREGMADGHGIEARLLPMILNTLLKVRDAKAELPSQRPIIAQADILMRGFALVGITALIDEATGYKRDKEKEALAKIMEAFVAKEMQPWVRTFPAEYFQNLCRLYNVEFPPKSNRMPQYFGTMTNNAIYSRLAPTLLTELKKAKSASEKKAKLHQFLTTDKGHPKLKEHLAVTVAMQTIAKTPDEWIALMDRVKPQFNTTMQLPLDDAN
jgi:hypothetical protein